MEKKTKAEEGRGGVSKLQLAVGAASLFLFIVGLKRTFQVEDGAGSRAVSDGKGTQPAEARAKTAKPR